MLLGALLMMCGDTSAQEDILEGEPYFTGTYTGGFACDLTVNGKPGADFLPAEMQVVQLQSGRIDLAMTFQFEGSRAPAIAL